MSVEDRIAERAAKAKVFKQSPNMNSGAIYELEFERVEATEGQNKEGADTDWFTFEFKVISCELTLTPDELAARPASKRPNQPGSSLALPLDTNKKWAAGVLLACLSETTGESQEELTKVKEVNGRKGTTIGLLQGPLQPLRGCRIMCEAFDKPLRGKPATPENMRCRQRWFHNESTKAATKAILGQ